MMDDEAWLILFHALISGSEHEIVACAKLADQALEQYRRRFLEPEEE